VFLTLMSLDVNRPQTQHILAPPDELQTVVEGMFEGLRVNTVWRLDLIGSRQYIAVASPIRPTPVLAHEQYGYPGCFPSWETRVLDDELEKATAGTHWQFRLAAATLIDRDHDTASQLRLAAANGTDAQRLWLQEQGQQYGFKPEEIIVEHSHVLFLPQKSGKDMMIQRTEFSGILTVTSPDALAQAMIEGVGGENRYGLGLITLDEPGTWHHV